MRCGKQPFLETFAFIHRKEENYRTGTPTCRRENWPVAEGLDSICAKVNSSPYILIYLEFHSSKDQPTTKHNIRYSVQVRIGQRMVEIHERQARGGQRAALRSPLQLATHRPMRRRAQSPPPRPWAPPRRLPPCAHRCARRASNVSSSSRGSWRSRCTCHRAR